MVLAELQRSGQTGEMPPSPRISESLPRRERLLGKSFIGVQAILLFGDTMPKPDTPVSQASLKSILSDNSEERRKRINTGSLHERTTYWSQDEFKGKDHRAIWEEQANKLLEIYKKPADDRYIDQFTNQREFLMRLGIDVETTEEGGPARTLYQTFISERGEGKGDIDYFARRVVETYTRDEIEDNQNLIHKLAGMYGANSAKVAELIAYGLKNIETDAQGFVRAAYRALQARPVEGMEIINTLTAQNQEWEAQQQASSRPRTERRGRRRSRVAPSTPIFERDTQESEAQQPAAVVHGEGFVKSEKGDGSSHDVFFADDASKTYAVLDGSGPTQAAELAREYLHQEMAKIPDTLSLDETIERVRDAIMQTNQQVIKANQGETTLVLAKVWQGVKGQQSAIIAWVGDSRGYLQHEKKLQPVTEDDDVLKRLQRLGHIVHPEEVKRVRKRLGEFTDIAQLSREQGIEVHDSIRKDWDSLRLNGIDHFTRNGRIIIPECVIWAKGSEMFQALGDSRMSPNIEVVDVVKGDKLVLTTDGVHDVLTTDQINDLVTQYGQDSKKASAMLVTEAERISDEHYQENQEAEKQRKVEHPSEPIGEEDEHATVMRILKEEIIPEKRVKADDRTGVIINIG